MPSSKKKNPRAAGILYQVVRAYKPSWYDVFGYDFSGRRQRLIETFVDFPHDKSIDKRYGKELTAICKSHRRGKLMQERRFGLLVNKIFEDLHLTVKSKKVRSEINPAVLKIAKASKNEYLSYRASLKNGHNHHHHASA